MQLNLLSLCCAALLTTGTLSSCVREVDLDYQRPTPSLVVNSIISSDREIKVQLSKTVLFTESDREAPWVENAIVTLSVDGGTPTRLSPLPASLTKAQLNGVYVGEQRVQAGQRVTLEVKTADGYHATASGMMPARVPIKDYKFSYADVVHTDDTYYSGGQPTEKIVREINHQITFTDPAGERNYYLIRVCDPNGEGVEIDHSRDELFLSQLKSVDRFDASYMLTNSTGMTFTDDRINGQTYTLTLLESTMEPHYYQQHPVLREVRLYSISEDYYRYLTQVVVNNEDGFNSALVEAGLADPALVHNNIVGGVGIFGLMQIARGVINVGVQDTSQPTPSAPDLP